MQNVKVLYEESGDCGEMHPVWMIVDDYCLDWDRIMYIDIHAPFERLIFDQIESDFVAVTVPDAAYIRHRDKMHLIGIDLPIVRRSAGDAVSLDKYKSLDLGSINRLVLRICDIEDALQYDLQHKLQF